MVTSGKINEDTGLNDVLSMVVSRSGATRAILRILSKEVSGRLSIREATYITGAQVQSTGAHGHAAVRDLLGVQRGVFAYFEPEDTIEFDEVNEGLRIPVAQLIGGNPQQIFEQMARQYGFEFVQPQKPQMTPEQLLMRFMGSARISWKEIVHHTFSGMPANTGTGGISDWRLQAQRTLSGLTALVAPRQSLRKVPRITLSAKKREVQEAPVTAAAAPAMAVPPDAVDGTAAVDGGDKMALGRRASDRVKGPMTAELDQAISAATGASGGENAAASAPPRAMPPPQTQYSTPTTKTPPREASVSAQSTDAPLSPQAAGNRVTHTIASALGPGYMPTPPGRNLDDYSLSDTIPVGRHTALPEGGIDAGGNASYFTQPDLPRDVEMRQVISAGKPRPVNAGAEPPHTIPSSSAADVLRRTAQKIKSRLLVEKETMETSAHRLAKSMRLKAIEQESDTDDAPANRLPFIGVDRATAMGAVITVAIITAVIACKILGDMASPEEQVRKGQKCLAMGQFDLAIDDLSLALAKQPNNVQALCSRAKAFSKIGQSKNALEDLNKMLALAGSKAPASCLFERAQMLFDLGKLSESAAACDAVLSIKPNDADALALKGMVDARCGKYKAALVELAKVPDYMTAEAAIHRGFALWKLNRLDDALQQYQIAAKAFPNNASVLAEEELVEQQLGTFKQPGALTADKETGDNSDGRSLLTLGCKNYDEGKFSQAASYLSAAADKGACDYRARAMLARALAKSGDQKAAYQQLLALGLVGGLEPSDRIALVDCANNEATCDDCITVLSKFLKDDPHSVETRVALIKAYKKSGQREMASSLAKEGMQSTRSLEEKYLLQSTLN